MAAPSPRTATHVITASGTSVTATEPGSSAANDIMLLWWLVGSGSSARIGPTGWMQLAEFVGSNVYGQLLITRRGSSPPALGFSWTTAAYSEVGCIAVSGCDTGPLMLHDFAFNMPATRTAPDCPVVQSTVAECLAIAFGMNFTGSSGGATAPSGYTMTAIGDAAGDDLCVATKVVNTASIESPAVFGGSFGSDTVFEATVLLMPPQSAVAVPGNFRGSRGRRTRYGF